MPRWFDAHLDLACLALRGREVTAPLDPDAPPHPPAAVTLPALAEGGVTDCLATIFTEALGPGDEPSHPSSAYPAGDAEAAHEAGRRQLACYDTWREQGLVEFFGPGQGRHAKPAHQKLRMGILIEAADPIRTPDELPWWQERGVVAVGMAWWRSSRYAGGNGTEEGLTGLGRALAGAMDELGIVHDLSHLSQRATDELLALTDRPVIASHSNCRALVDGENQRHLSDDVIAEVGRRGGVIGLNLCSPFLVPGGAEEVRATIDQCLDHVERICGIQGNRHGVGLGSDMDGGFSAAKLPEGIDRPAGLERLAEGLSARGWPPRDVDAFRHGNWARFWGL
jgi:membrane dipeptidase